MVYIKAC
jgi:hypothetical protein